MPTKPEVINQIPVHMPEVILQTAIPEEKGPIENPQVLIVMGSKTHSASIKIIADEEEFPPHRDSILGEINASLSPKIDGKQNPDFIQDPQKRKRLIELLLLLQADEIPNLIQEAFEKIKNDSRQHVPFNADTLLYFLKIIKRDYPSNTPRVTADRLITTYIENHRD